MEEQVAAAEVEMAEEAGAEAARAKRLATNTRRLRTREE